MRCQALCLMSHRSTPCLQATRVGVQVSRGPFPEADRRPRPHLRIRQPLADRRTWGLRSWKAGAAQSQEREPASCLRGSGWESELDPG